MNALETYLRRSTRGVWGTKRTELIAELRGSIEARIWMLECQGYAPERALEAALTELGEPRAIAAGLIGVHTMPRILRSTLAFGLFAALSVTLINSSRAQIEVAVMGTRITLTSSSDVSGTLTDSSGNSIVLNETPQMAGYLLNFESIQRNLEAAGISVTVAQSKPLVAFDRVSLVPTMTFNFSGSARKTVLQANPLVWKNADGNLIWGNAVQPPAKIAASDYYVPIWSFLTQLRKQTDLPIELTGWRNPKLKIGSTVLQIGSDRMAAVPWEIYASIAGRAALNDFPQMNGWMYTSNAHKFGIRTNSAAGAVYAVMTTSVNPNQLHVDATRVADDGVLYFDAPHKVLEFVKTPLELVRDRTNIDKRGYGSSSRPAKALLVRITPDLKTSFVLPARVRSAALR